MIFVPPYHNQDHTSFVLTTTYIPFSANVKNRNMHRKSGTTIESRMSMQRLQNTKENDCVATQCKIHFAVQNIHSY